MGRLVTLIAQVARYGIVGLASNAVLYVLYLGITGIGLEPKLAMSVVFLGGIALTFLFHKRWTFAHKGSARLALARYVWAYGTAYGLNLASLLVFVDLAGLPHQVVQAATVLTLAALLFLAQRFWVFRPAAPT